MFISCVSWHGFHCNSHLKNNYICLYERTHGFKTAPDPSKREFQRAAMGVRPAAATLRGVGRAWSSWRHQGSARARRHFPGPPGRAAGHGGPSALPAVPPRGSTDPAARESRASSFSAGVGIGFAAEDASQRSVCCPPMSGWLRLLIPRKAVASACQARGAALYSLSKQVVTY